MEFVMDDVVTKRVALARGTAAMTETGEIPALIGALGAAFGFFVMGAFLAPVSLPLSVLGLVLGVRRRRFSAVCLGAFGIVCAMIVLTRTPGFWFLLEMVSGAQPS